MSWPQNWTHNLAPAPVSNPSISTIPHIPGAAVNPYVNPLQYQSLPPEQQFALQQNWQQWQTYQQQYAQWHAQYGEQYQREMQAKFGQSVIPQMSQVPPLPPNAPVLPPPPPPEEPHEMQKPPPPNMFHNTLPVTSTMPPLISSTPNDGGFLQRNITDDNSNQNSNFKQNNMYNQRGNDCGITRGNQKPRWNERSWQNSTFNNSNINPNPSNINNNNNTNNNVRNDNEISNENAKYDNRGYNNNNSNNNRGVNRRGGFNGNKRNFNQTRDFPEYSNDMKNIGRIDIGIATNQRTNDNKIQSQFVNHLPVMDNRNITNTVCNESGIDKDSPEEKLFDDQFKKWEDEFNRWKRENANHPDRQAYAEYEMKFEDCRRKLLERREHMRNKKLEEKKLKNLNLNLANSNIRTDISLTNFNTPPPNIQSHIVHPPAFIEPNKEKIQNKQGPETTSFNFRSDNVFQKSFSSDIFKSNCSVGIPGLDLVVPSQDEEERSEKLDCEVTEVINLIDEPVVQQSHQQKKLLADPIVTVSPIEAATPKINPQIDNKMKPDFDVISRNINTLLGDPNLLSLLSKVADTKNLTTTPNVLLNAISNTIKQNDPALVTNVNNNNNNNTASSSNNNKSNSNFPSFRNDQIGNFDRIGNDDGKNYKETQNTNNNSWMHSFSNNRENNNNSGNNNNNRDYNRDNNNSRDNGCNQWNYNNRNEDRWNNRNMYSNNDSNDSRFDYRNRDQNQRSYNGHQGFDSTLDNNYNSGNFNRMQSGSSMDSDRYNNMMNDRYDNMNNDRYRDSGNDRYGNNDRYRDNDRYGDSDDRLSRSSENNFNHYNNNGKNSNYDRYNNDDGEFFKPTHVIDYQNKSQKVNKTMVSSPWDDLDTLTPSKVVDYGHKKTATLIKDKDNDFMPVKTFDYGHSSSIIKKEEAIVRPMVHTKHDDNIIKSKENMNNIDGLNNKKRKNSLTTSMNNKKIKKNQNKFSKKVQKQYEYKNELIYPCKWVLINDTRTRPGLPTKRGKRGNKNNLKMEKLKNFNENNNNNTKDIVNMQIKDLIMSVQNVCNNITKPLEDDLEEVSSNEDVNEAKITDIEDISDNEDNFIDFDDDDDDTVNGDNNSGGGVDKSETKIIEKKELIQITLMKNTINIDDILLMPGRKVRPIRIVIIMRGPPGSGKSYLAKLIKDKEVEMGGSPPRLLSIDDYIMTECEEEDDNIENADDDDEKDKIINTIEIEKLNKYKTLEEKCLQYLIKSFKKTITDRLFDFIIVDCINGTLNHYNEFHNYAKNFGFCIYTCEMTHDVELCAKRNLHNRTVEDIQEVINRWEQTPDNHIKINYKNIFIVQNVKEITEIKDDTEEKSLEKLCENSNESTNMDKDKNDNENENDNDNDNVQEFGLFKSKWETGASEMNLARLDGISKPLRHTTIEDYLQLDGWEPSVSNKSGQKRVRWADIEEKLAQDKMRAIGFVVGQTDWNRMMDPTQGGSALTQTKYIARIKK